jgi:Cof subfamily protein (haloacid dehalogenase superfamily)
VGLPERVRLIATDLDGTLLRDDKTIGRAEMAALRGAADVGLILVAATGRQPGTVPVDLAACGVRYLVAANGAIGVDHGTGEILFETEIDAESVAAIATVLRRVLPDARLSAARDHGRHYVVEPGYAELVQPSERLPSDYLTAGSAHEVTSEPTLKLTVRHPELSPEQLLEIVGAAAPAVCQLTTSGAPFLEIGGAGVNKATGLARLGELLGVDASQVVAFGDAGNDVEMLAWAGYGVAMGNASDAAKAVADHVTSANDAGGLAAVVEALLAQRRLTDKRGGWKRPATAS